MTGRSETTRNRRPRGSELALGLAAALLLAAAGCEEERNVNLGGPPRSTAAKSPAAPQPEFIVGQRTQEIKNAAPELQQGARVATTQITARDPITLQGNAYVTTIGRTSILLIEQAMNLYHAEHDRYPRTYDEFMTEIIKANNIALPKLPHYQQYGYDEREHKLIILEYPELKNQPLGTLPSP
jgi:hypothetical protein